MNKILLESKRYKKIAEQILKESRLVNVLEEFGEVRLVGSYVNDIMMGGDIDIYVINKSFKRDTIIKAFNLIAKSCKFKAYLFSDWNLTRSTIFPKACYLGIKTVKNKIKWKIDIWFLTPRDLKRVKGVDMSNIGDRQKLAILRFKDYRNKFETGLSSMIIYKAVLLDGVLILVDFKRYLRNIKR